MSFFSSLDTERYDRQYSDLDLVRRIVRYFRPHRRDLIWIALCLALISFSGAAIPLLVSRSVDLLSGSPTNRGIVLLSSAVLVSGIISWGANWIRRRLTARAVGDVVLALRTDAFKAAMDHDLSFFDEFSSGKIVSRITSDTREFGQLVVLVTDLISQIFQAIILGIVLIGIEWRL
ncbi:MAG: ABC transporter transmembrane domain-containing protein, partial [Anaerolineales bacterium]